MKPTIRGDKLSKPKDSVIIVLADYPYSDSVMMPVSVFPSMSTAEEVLTPLLHTEPTGNDSKKCWSLSELKKKIENGDIPLSGKLLSHIKKEFCCEDDEEAKEIFEYQGLEIYLGFNMFKRAAFSDGGPSKIVAKTITFGKLRLFEYDFD